MCICDDTPSKQTHCSVLTTCSKLKSHSLRYKHAPAFFPMRRCRHRYPKPFCEATQPTDDGYPVYRRRPPGPLSTGHTVDRKGQHYTNSNVVPYNAWLLLKYRSHINIEVCSSQFLQSIVHFQLFIRFPSIIYSQSFYVWSPVSFYFNQFMTHIGVCFNQKHQVPA
jgi:hypothetical protein